MDLGQLIEWVMSNGTLFTSDVEPPVVLITHLEDGDHSLHAAIARFSEHPRTVRDNKPILFLFNNSLDGEGIHWSGLLVGDGKGLRMFEPADRGTQSVNQPLINATQYFLQALELQGKTPFGAIGSCEQLGNLCPPQRVMQQGATACGRALIAGLLLHLQPSYAHAVSEQLARGHGRRQVFAAWVTGRDMLDIRFFTDEKTEAEGRLNASSSGGGSGSGGGSQASQEDVPPEGIDNIRLQQEDTGSRRWVLPLDEQNAGGGEHIDLTIRFVFAHGASIIPFAIRLKRWAQQHSVQGSGGQPRGEDKVLVDMVNQLCTPLTGGTTATSGRGPVREPLTLLLSGDQSTVLGVVAAEEYVSRHSFVLRALSPCVQRRGLASLLLKLHLLRWNVAEGYPLEAVLQWACAQRGGVLPSWQRDGFELTPVSSQVADEGKTLTRTSESHATLRHEIATQLAPTDLETGRWGPLGQRFLYYLTGASGTDVAAQGSSSSSSVFADLGPALNDMQLGG